MKIDPRERYDRQIRLYGPEAQERLAKTTVLVVGVGGLGSAASIYLAASGVGKLIIVDGDRVSASNLNRQILYRPGDLGKQKALVAAERLREINPDVVVEPVPERLTEENVEELVSRADIVVDGLDNWGSRMILDRACWVRGKPMVHAGVYGVYGQLTTIVPGETPCLRCIVPSPREAQGPQPVLGPTPGILGAMEALEAIKLATGYGEPAKNKLLIIDMYTAEVATVPLKPTRECLQRCSQGQEAP